MLYLFNPSALQDCSSGLSTIRTRLPASAGRRGSVGFLLVLAVLLALIILPAGTNLIGYLHRYCLAVRGQQAVDQVLAGTPLCLDQQALGHGQLQVSHMQVEQFVLHRLSETWTTDASHTLQVEAVNIQLIPVDSAQTGWLDPEREHIWPLITCYASINGRQGLTIPIWRSVALVLD